jgi:hypothetical protein
MSSFEVDPVADPNLGDAARAEQLDPPVVKTLSTPQGSLRAENGTTTFVGVAVVEPAPAYHF